MFAIGIGPAGVSAVNESSVSSPPSGLSSATIQLRSFTICSEPEGRSPKETAFRVYASACRASNRSADGGVTAGAKGDNRHVSHTTIKKSFKKHARESKVEGILRRLD